MDIKNIIEAVLFAFSDPISKGELRDIIDPNMEIKYIETIIDNLKDEYADSNRGIQILKIENKYQMCTNKKYEEYVKKLFEPKKKKSLTQAALETLAIVAYKQPITKVEIEEIRGVKCDKAINTLLEYNLIIEAGRLNRIGKPIIYKTTDEFLKVFALEKLKELPDISSFEEIEKNENEV